MKKNIVVIVAALVLTSCGNQKTETKEPENEAAKTEAKADLSLIGRPATVIYGDTKIGVTYISDSVLHWKTVDVKGVVTEMDEEVFYTRLSESLHFVNWIEKDGFTVSQVIDTKNGTSKAFWSFASKNSKQGGRAAEFKEGKFVFDK